MSTTKSINEAIQKLRDKAEANKRLDKQKMKEVSHWDNDDKILAEARKKGIKIDYSIKEKQKGTKELDTVIFEDSNEEDLIDFGNIEEDTVIEEDTIIEDIKDAEDNINYEEEHIVFEQPLQLEEDTQYEVPIRITEPEDNIREEASLEDTMSIQDESDLEITEEEQISNENLEEVFDSYKDLDDAFESYEESEQSGYSEDFEVVGITEEYDDIQVDIFDSMDYEDSNEIEYEGVHQNIGNENQENIEYESLVSDNAIEISDENNQVENFGIQKDIYENSEDASDFETEKFETSFIQSQEVEPIGGNVQSFDNILKDTEQEEVFDSMEDSEVFDSMENSDNSETEVFDSLEEDYNNELDAFDDYEEATDIFDSYLEDDIEIFDTYEETSYSIEEPEIEVFDDHEEASYNIEKPEEFDASDIFESGEDFAEPIQNYGLFGLEINDQENYVEEDTFNNYEEEYNDYEEEYDDYEDDY